MPAALSIAPARTFAIPAMAEWPEGFAIWRPEVGSMTVTQLAWEGFCLSICANGTFNPQTSRDTFIVMLLRAFLNAKPASEVRRLDLASDSFVNESYRLQFNLQLSEQRIMNILIPPDWRDARVHARLRKLDPKGEY